MGLPLAAVYALACVAHPPLLGWYGLAAMVVAIPVAATLAIALTLQVRGPGASFPRSCAGRACLVVLVPAAYAFAWLNGAGSFCF